MCSLAVCQDIWINKTLTKVSSRGTQDPSFLLNTGRLLIWGGDTHLSAGQGTPQEQDGAYPQDGHTHLKKEQGNPSQGRSTSAGGGAHQSQGGCSCRLRPSRSQAKAAPQHKALPKFTTKYVLRHMDTTEEWEQHTQRKFILVHN